MRLKLRENIYEKFETIYYLLDDNKDSLDFFAFNQNIYEKFILTLIQLLNGYNILNLRDDLPGKLMEFLNSSVFKFHEENHIITNSRKVLKRHVNESRTAHITTRKESIYFHIIDEKLDREIDDDINITTSDIINLHKRDYINYGIMIDKNDELDHLELFSFISTSFKLLNYYSDIIDNEPIIKSRMDTIARYLYINNICDKKYENYIDRYYNKLISRINYDDNVVKFKIIK